MFLSLGVEEKKKTIYKSFYVKLNYLDKYGNKQRLLKILPSKIKIQPWVTIKQILNKIANAYNVHNNKNIQLFFENTQLFPELKISDYKILEKKKPEIDFKITMKKTQDFSIQVYGAFPCHTILRNNIDDILNGFVEGLTPKFLEDGTSGTYFLKGCDRSIKAVFKPIDEEAYAPNNQKGYINKFGSTTFRTGILSGEGAIREFAAYYLDANNFFDVPPTTFVEISHKSFNKNNMNMLINKNDINNNLGWITHNFLINNITSEGYDNKNKNLDLYKNSISDNTVFGYNDDSNYERTSNKNCNYIAKKYGSLQTYVKHFDVAENLSFSLYSVEEVHKIAILDFRIINCDRNEGNILVLKIPNKNYKNNNNNNDDDYYYSNNNKKYYYKLIPIDHCLTFPDCLKIFDYELCWTGWDQANQPFSEKMKKYIENIDIIADMERLSKVIKLRENCWKIFRIGNIVLKKGAEFDLTPLEISNILYQTDYKHDTPSQVQMIIKKTDEIFSIMKIDKRSRIFSTNENYINENDENQLNNNNENKKGFDRERKKKYSLLKRTTSEPNLNEDNNDKNDNDEDEYSGLGVKKNVKIFKNKKKRNDNQNDSNNSQQIIFDYPLNEIYFQYFEDFLIELIKKTYPEKYNLKKKNSNASYKNSLDNNSNKNSIDRNNSTNNSIDVKETN